MQEYDPAGDEKIYSMREMEHVSKAVFRMGWDAAIEFVAESPLSIHGRWEPDTVYDPNSLVQHEGGAWLSLVQTASAPSAANGAWRAVGHLSRLLSTEEERG